MLTQLLAQNRSILMQRGKGDGVSEIEKQKLTQWRIQSKCEKNGEKEMR